MNPEVRKRLFAVVSLIFIFTQCPFANLNAPAAPSADGSGPVQGTVPMSILQVAVASFVEGKRVPKPILKAALVPGILAHDLYRAIDCKMGSDVACNEPVAMEHLDDVFSMTSPLYEPKAIRYILKRNFPNHSELITAGSTLVLGSAIMSMIYPIKFGFFGLLMVMYALFKEGVLPYPPGLMFIPVFAIATDIASMFRRSPRGVAAQGAQPTGDTAGRAKQS